MSSRRQVATNRLSLVPREASRVSVVGSREVRTTVPFLDFVIDDVPLRTMAQGAGHGSDYVTPLCRAWVTSEVAKAVDLLRRGTSDQRERADMLVCVVCGDRDCGAVLTDVSVGEELVTWSNWRWTDYETPGETITQLPVFRFERREYQDLLATAPATLSGLPYDESADRPRLLWPWQWGWRLPRGRE